MLSTSDRLRALRHAYRRRGGHRTAADAAYAAYLVVLGVPLVVVPVVRAVVLALLTPSVSAALTAPGAVGAVGVVLGLLSAGLVWLGGLYGPVTLEPALAVLLAGTDLPRRRALLRPFLGRAAVVVVTSTAAAVVCTGVLVATGAADRLGALRFTALCLVYAAVGAVLWLAGQAWIPRAAGAMGGVITGLSLLAGAVSPARVVLPWCWVASAWPTTATSFAPTDLAVLVVGAVAVASVAPLLDRLHGGMLVDAGVRWRSAGTAVVTGDVALALGSLRARPSVGRRWRAVRGGASVPVFLVRDLVGAVRTPVRLAVGVVTLAAAALVLERAGDVPGGWLLGAVSGGLAFGALGVLADGFRHAVDVAVAPPVYGLTTTGLFVRHAGAPLLAVLVAGTTSLGADALLNVHVRPVTLLVVLVLVVLVRAYDSARGMLPLVLLTPVPSPMGDLSSLNVLLWQADSLLLAAGIGGAAVAAGSAGASAVRLLVAGAVVAALLVVGLRRRLRRL